MDDTMCSHSGCVQARKRARQGDPGGSSGKVRKLTLSNDKVTITTYRQFQQRYSATFSVDVFVGLCAYLYVLLRWGYDITATSYDSFLNTYHHFQDTIYAPQKENTPLVYHTWFIDTQLREDMCGVVVDGNALSAVSRENQYTFNFVEKSMEIIADLKD